jgi:hypothetical protein
MKFINLTPHAIKLNDGTTFPPSGVVARVSADLQAVETVGGVQLFRQKFGEVEGLPAEVPGTMYIVSALVFSAVDRDDCVAPATSSKETIRDEAGHIVSVPGFVTKWFELEELEEFEEEE